jgi:hypothetical protein
MNDIGTFGNLYNEFLSIGFARFAMYRGGVLINGGCIDTLHNAVTADITRIYIITNVTEFDAKLPALGAWLGRMIAHRFQYIISVFFDALAPSIVFKTKFILDFGHNTNISPKCPKFECFNRDTDSNIRVSISPLIWYTTFRDIIWCLERHDMNGTAYKATGLPLIADDDDDNPYTHSLLPRGLTFDDIQHAVTLQQDYPLILAGLPIDVQRKILKEANPVFCVLQQRHSVHNPDEIPQGRSSDFTSAQVMAQW